MKKIILNLLAITSVLFLASCSEKSGNISDSNVNNNNQISNISNDSTGANLENTNSGEIQNITPKDDVKITDNIKLISIKSPGEYILLSENLKGEKKEFNFLNEHLQESRYITSRLDDWQDNNKKVCYISELEKQVYYYMTNNPIILDELNYDENIGWKGIIKIFTSSGIINIGDKLYNEGYLFNFDITSPTLKCKCNNNNKINNYSYSDEIYKLVSVNNDLSFTLGSSSGEKIEFIEKDLSKFKMTAGLKSDCYLDMLKSQIKSNLNSKEFALGNYDSSSRTGEIILDKDTGFSLIDLLQKQGFLENECNTNDIEPMLMKWCQK